VCFFCSLIVYADCTTPTNFPSKIPFVPVSWTCNPIYYNQNDGCDCDCGVRDPDCDKEFNALYCNGIGMSTPSQVVCALATCVDTSRPTEKPTSVPTEKPTSVPTPTDSPTKAPTKKTIADWKCSPAQYGTNDGCNCECSKFYKGDIYDGIPTVDPDCYKDEYTLFCGGTEKKKGICNLTSDQCILAPSTSKPSTKPSTSKPSTKPSPRPTIKFIPLPTTKTPSRKPTTPTINKLRGELCITGVNICETNFKCTGTCTLYGPNEPCNTQNSNFGFRNCIWGGIQTAEFCCPIGYTCLGAGPWYTQEGICTPNSNPKHNKH